MISDRGREGGRGAALAPGAVVVAPVGVGERGRREGGAFFFLFFTDGPAGAKKYLDIGREGKLSIYSFAQILTRSKRAGRSYTVKSRS